jgi:hypothetical protein
MDANGPTDKAGVRLKLLRERLGLTLRGVETLSRRLAQEKQNQDFFICGGDARGTRISCDRSRGCPSDQSRRS